MVDDIMPRLHGNYAEDVEMLLDEIDELRGDLLMKVHRVGELADEIERLRRWKAEAIAVLERWDKVSAMCRPRLGEFKSEAVAREIERLRRTVQDRDEWNDHLASRESSLLLAVPRPFRMWVDRRARKEARRG